MKSTDAYRWTSACFGHILMQCFDVLQNYKSRRSGGVHHNTLQRAADRISCSRRWSSRNWTRSQICFSINTPALSVFQECLIMSLSIRPSIILESSRPDTAARLYCPATSPAARWTDWHYIYNNTVTIHSLSRAQTLVTAQRYHRKHFRFITLLTSCWTMIWGTISKVLYCTRSEFYFQQLLEYIYMI